MTYKSNYKVQCTRFYQCGRKTLFVDKQSAATRAGQINKKEGKRLLEPYRCSHCNGWHLRRVKSARK